MPRPCSRRTFLSQAGAASLALAGLSRRGRAADDADQAKKDKYGGFLMGIQSYTLRDFPVDDALVHVHDLGLGAIEFFDAHFSLKSSAEEIADMRQKTAKLGIQIRGHGVNGFSKDHEANRKIFEFAKKAGIKNISADPSEDSFASLDKLVAEFDIRIAIHNHGPKARYNKVADVLNAIEGHDERIGACADLGHYIRSAEDPVRAIQLLKGRLYGVHLKDFADQKDETKGVILGQGHLDVEGVFRALREVEFPADGCLSLEYEENPKDPLEDVRQCLDIASKAAIKTL